MQTQVLTRPTGEQWQSVLRFRQLPILAETRQTLRQTLKSPALTFSSLTPGLQTDQAQAACGTVQLFAAIRILLCRQL